MPVNRQTRATEAHRTLSILRTGSYNVSGIGYSISDALQCSFEKTEHISESDSNSWFFEPLFKNPSFDTSFEVKNESTVHALKRLSDIQPDARIGVLNFCSPKVPGGGFLRGSSSQEESLAISSALYPTLIKYQKEFYIYHRVIAPQGLYSDGIIYSPQVPFFRNDELELFGPPSLADVVTCPAVNVGSVLDKDLHKISFTMITRIRKILLLFQRKKCTHLVLGAYGCGVFRNSVHFVSNTFKELLKEKGQFEGVFKSVIFAILTQNEEKFLEPFKDAIHYQD